MKNGAVCYDGDLRFGPGQDGVQDGLQWFAVKRTIADSECTALSVLFVGSLIDSFSTQ